VLLNFIILFRTENSNYKQIKILKIEKYSLSNRKKAIAMVLPLPVYLGYKSWREKKSQTMKNQV